MLLLAVVVEVSDRMRIHWKLGDLVQGMHPHLIGAHGIMHTDFLGSLQKALQYPFSSIYHQKRFLHAVAAAVYPRLSGVDLLGSSLSYYQTYDEPKMLSFRH